jgi:hypothetical protein
MSKVFVGIKHQDNESTRLQQSQYNKHRWEMTPSKSTLSLKQKWRGGGGECLRFMTELSEGELKSNKTVDIIQKQNY